MPPVAANEVLAIHRSLCRNFRLCIFDSATYSCVAVSAVFKCKYPAIFSRLQVVRKSSIIFTR